LRSDGKKGLVAELLKQQFQSLLWKNGSIAGVGGARPGVVSFIVFSESEDAPKEAEKIARQSTSENSPLEKTQPGRVRPGKLFTHARINVDQSV